MFDPRHERTKPLVRSEVQERGSATNSNTQSRAETHAGLVYTIAASSIWGLAPIYWKLVREVPVVQMLGHRVIWSLPCLLLLLLLRRQGGDLLKALGDGRIRLALLASTLLIGSNWLLFIWAVNTDRILQASLGYYINPLANVALGALLLGERMSHAQGWAVVIASAGVALMAWHVGSVPWISVGLASTFALYGLVRKVVATGALVGLTLEVMVLAPIAIWGLHRLESQGHGVFLSGDLGTRVLIIASGLVTAIPLLLFTEGARRLRYSTVGLLQYLAPSGHFLLAVLVYGEELSTEKLVSFSLIWASLILYSLEARRAARVTAAT